MTIDPTRTISPLRNRGYVIVCEAYTSREYRTRADAERALAWIQNAGECPLEHWITGVAE